MSNQFNLICPECGSAYYLDIQAQVWVRATEDGTDADAAHENNHTWDLDSACCCDNCDWVGIVRDAEVKPA